MKSVALALALIAAPADAEVVMMEPPVVVACGSPASMAALTTCLDQHLLVGTQLGSIAGPANQPNGARLFAIAAKDARHHELQSVALFLQDAKGRWRIAGHHELDGARGEITLTRFEKIGLAKHQGYRFDLSVMQASSHSLDGVTSQPTVTREVQAHLCGGDSYACTTLVESCQVLVDGQVYEGWQGSLVITGDSVVLSGSGTQPACGQPGAWTLSQLGFHLRANF